MAELSEFPRVRFFSVFNFTFLLFLYRFFSCAKTR